jgi:hypothetical protein
MSLYATLLGSAWASLAPAVRRLHGGSARAHGQLRVRRGTGLAARVLAAILGMPSRGERIAVTLAVESKPDGERWARVFGKRPLTTLQWSRGQLLYEALGLVQCVFRLRAEDGALIFEQVSALLGVRRFALTLPRFLAPVVVGRAEPCGEEVRLDVSVRAPGVGLLVAYDGLVVTDPRSREPLGSAREPAPHRPDQSP